MKKNFKYIALIALLTSASGCKKYLETSPDQRANLNTPSKISELLTTAYPHGNYIPFCEAMSDNADDKGVAAGGGELINKDPWLFKDVSSRDLDSPEFYWYSCYSAIAAANQALAAIAKVSDPQNYTAQKGEALLARAYAHFMLVTLFSKIYDPSTAGSDPGIPYVLEPENVVIKRYERKTVAYVYEQIDKDIVEGMPLLSATGYTVPKFHFTPAAGHAFASRFYLFKKDYAKVVEHANLVFAGGNIAQYLRDFVSPAYRALEPKAKDVQYTNSETASNILLQEANSNWGEQYPGYRYALASRLATVTMRATTPFGGSWAYMVYGQDLYYNLRKFPTHRVYTAQGATTYDPYNMIPLFAAEEVLFNRAEANTYLGNLTAAFKDLNDLGSRRVVVSQANPVYVPASHTLTEAKVKSFFGVTDVKEGLIKTILTFKRVEYTMEGLRWFDILRYNLPVVHNTGDLTQSFTLGPNDPRRVFQIPKEAEAAGLERNPR